METYLKRLKKSFLNIIHVSDHFRPLSATLKIPQKRHFLDIFKVCVVSRGFSRFSMVFGGFNHQKPKKLLKIDLKIIFESFLNILTIFFQKE
mgnify:CR=1 FL=1